MKKLLSLLSVLTISGSAVPTTIAASPYQKKENIKNIDINYQQTNNLKKIKRQDYKNAINWTINNGIIKSIIVGNNYASIKNNIVVLNDILYIFVQGSTIKKIRFINIISKLEKKVKL
ncbi:hypothetical protein [Spiroplasma endosymbiont of Seladonia tumulorum]|uniref:hypothetical protein n=1 Tax=Spiroplasma endosymbiont of Seladonia tumulorum TaxID=3066321 RepID=UPI0030D3F481